MAAQKRVGILQINPQTLWRQGGGEVHARKYIEYGNNGEFCVGPFDFQRPRDYDILHYFGSGYQLNEFGKYARLEGIRVVGTPILFPSRSTLKYRAMLLAGSKLPFPTTLNLRQQLLRDSDLLIANSRPEAAYFRNAYGIPAEKTSVLPTGVDEDLLEYVPAMADLPAALQRLEKYVLTVGRITPLKNQLALARLAVATGFPLVMIGQEDASHPAYAAAIRAICAQHSGIVWLSGGLPPGSPALKAAFAFAACHVLWSDTEVAALVNNEAIALGCPVVTRRLDTSAAILGDHAQYAGSDAELVAAVRALRTWAPEVRAATTQAAKAYVREHLTWSGIVDRCRLLYRKVLQES